MSFIKCRQSVAEKEGHICWGLLILLVGTKGVKDLKVVW